MPTSYEQKLAKKHGVSTATVARRRKEAEKIAEKEGKGGNQAYVTGILKKMMKEKK